MNSLVQEFSNGKCDGSTIKIFFRKKVGTERQHSHFLIENIEVKYLICGVLGSNWNVLMNWPEMLS